MNVWLMNLKDNRDNPVQDLDMTKFEFCKSKGILGIGWVGYDENSDDSAFLLANNYLNSFAVGDLVWTRDPENKKYYLCKIKTIAQNANEEFNKYDISRYCNCDYIEVGLAEELPAGIDKESLVARHTIQKASDNVSAATFVFGNKKSAELKKNKKGSLGKFIKKHMKALIVIAVVIAIIVGGFIAFDTIRDQIAYNNVRNQLNGKTFMSETYGGGYAAFSIRDGKISFEEYNGTDTIEGDINSYENLEVDTRIFSQNTVFIKTLDRYIANFELQFDGTITYDSSWKEITIGEFKDTKKVITCQHLLNNTEITKKATCTENGEKTITCKACGYTTTETIYYLDHKYENGVCKYCKQEEPPEKTDLDGDTWYYSNKVPNLKVQNFVVTNVSPLQNSVMVQGYYFCSHCNVIDDWPQLYTLHFSNEVNKFHTCDYCEKTTTVRLKLE